VTWLKDDSLEDSDELPEPQDLAGEAIVELEAVVDDLREIITLLEGRRGEMNHGSSNRGLRG
jgi:type I restriction enzyme M protein